MASDCINWTRAIDTRGYGHLKLNGKTVRAHRHVWETSHGPIPNGLHVLHRCDNRKCINLDHLFLGTHADNMADMRAKGRRKGLAVGMANGRSRLTDEQIRAIRSDTRGKRVIAAQYHISPAQAQRIRLRLQWQTVA